MDSCTVADEVFDSCSSKNMLRFANGYHVACGSVSGVILSWNRVGEKLVPCMPVAKRMGSRRYVRVCFFYYAFPAMYGCVWWPLNLLFFFAWMG